MMYSKPIWGSWIALLTVASLTGCDQRAPNNPPKVEPLSEIARLQQLADSGDRDAQFTLGLRYENGDGVALSQEKAFKLLLKAAQAGKVVAMAEVADCYLRGNGVDPNREEYKKWLGKAAEEGDAKSQQLLANEYGWFARRVVWVWGENQDERQQNAKLMVEWLVRASTQKYVIAMHNLGMVYLLGVTEVFSEGGKYYVQPDIDKALPLLLEAAQRGYWNSQWVLAVAYQTGFAKIKADEKESNKWWDELSKQSDVGAELGLGNYYDETDQKTYKTGKNKWRGKYLSFEETNTIAADWYGKAAAQGDARANLLLGKMYTDGRGVFKNEKKAAEYYRAAAEKGDGEAMYTLGLAYVNGTGVVTDYALALDWFLKAANQKTNQNVAGEGQNVVGVMYENGWGTDKDDVLAYAWYNLAAANGNDMAKKNLAKVEKTLTDEDVRVAQTLSRDWKPGQLLNRGGATETETASASSGKASANTAGLKAIGSGTGIVISKIGHILSNQHVIGTCKEIRIPAMNKVAKLIVADQVNDLAVAKIDSAVGANAVFSESDKLAQGDDIAVFGYPLDGYLPASGNITPGIVSALAGPGNNSSIIQITAPVQPGSSGGPVLNKKGQLVGVVVGKADAIKIAKLTGDIPQNINFAIPSRTIKSFLEGNRIDYQKSSGFFGLFNLSKSMTDIADEARSYSVKLECWR